MKANWISLELASWLAAMIDGEGCIRLKKLFNKNIKRSPSYCIHLIISGTNEKLMNFLIDNFGGAIDREKSKNSEHKDALRWVIYGKKAVELLKIVFPYLILKSEQARMMIEYQKTIHPNGSKLSDSELCYRDYLFFKMKELNSRGT